MASISIDFRMASALAQIEPLLGHPDSFAGDLEMCVRAKRWWPSLLCGGHEPNWMARIEDLPLQYGESRHTACKFCQGEEQKKPRPTGMVLSGSRQATTAAREDKWGVTGILLSRSCLRPDPDENEHISPQLWRSACRSYINKQLLHHGQCSLSSITKEFYSGINSGYWQNFRTTTYILR